MIGGNPRKLDWTAILDGLAQLQTDNPDVLKHNALVGGAACLFYRDQLERLSDPDFTVRTYTEEEEKVWLSRDADFATTDPGQMPDSAGSVPLGRLQMGLVLGAEEFMENARNVELEWNGIQFKMLIADPLDLWREKEAATHRLTRPQDSLHLEVLTTTLEWEIAHFAEKVATGELPFDQWLSRVKEVRSRWNSVLNSQPLKARLLALNIREINQLIAATP